MRKSVVAIFGACASLAWLPASVDAQGYQWLDQSPISFFDDEDWELLRSTSREALEEGEVGETDGWHNEKTGASGTITVLETSEHEGMQCRRAKFFNSAGGVTGTGVFRMCKTADGTWKIAP
jgi:surface antigen